MKYIKKLSLVFLSFLMAISLIGCQSKNNEDVQKQFDAFIQKEFVESMENDYTSAHIFMENPKDFGVDMSKVKVGLGEYVTEESIQKNKKETADTLKEFKKFNRDDLTDEQKDTYDIYKFQADISEQLNDDKFDYYQQLFESMTGIHYQLPTMLADWQLRNEQDVKDLITVVNDIKPYVNSVIDYTKKQQEKGLLMIDIDSIIDYCQKVVKKGDKSSILTAMKESIDALSLDQNKSDDYKKQLTKAFQDSFIVTYQNIIDTMKTLKSGQNNENGYASFKYGKEYYELILQSNIGSDKSADKVKSMMQTAFNKHVLQLQSIVSKNPSLMNQKEPSTTYKNYNEILDSNKKHIFKDFPEVKNMDYNIKDINKEIASEDGVAAYFNIPALDQKGPKQLRVNPLSNVITSIETFRNVSHEGFPGHMYQNAYAYENLSSPYRKILASNSAYTEGYAVYSQFYAQKYLSGIDQNALELSQENQLATYDIIIMADIGIHYEGWTYDQFKEFFVQRGMTDDEKALKSTYKQIQANPCAFEPYYLGYEEIIELKDNAQEKLGDKFKDKDFHNALLKSGAAPFSVVERNINAYIESTK